MNRLNGANTVSGVFRILIMLHIPNRVGLHELMDVECWHHPSTKIVFGKVTSPHRGLCLEKVVFKSLLFFVFVLAGIQMIVDV